jgi:hypothetical protein
MTQSELRQFNQDTLDSIRGANNYQPNLGHGRESIHYAYKPDDVPDLDDWREREMELI